MNFVCRKTFCIPCFLSQFDTLVSDTSLRVVDWDLNFARSFRVSLAAALGVSVSRIIIVAIFDAFGGSVQFTSDSPTNADSAAFRRALADSLPAFRIRTRLMLSDNAAGVVDPNDSTTYSAALVTTPSSTLFSEVAGSCPLL